MFLVAPYLRISKEDGDKETSDSIENQRALIENFVNKHDDMKIVDYFIDDGVSGLTFDRPGFNRLIVEMFKGTINTIITKDMSRLGRDRLETGNYMEKIFPLNKVRYISILDNIDSLTGANADMAAFKGLLDEQYAKDISKKVKGAFDAKRFKGEFIGAFAPYGYKKDSSNKNKLVVDEIAAEIIKRIFTMFIGGTSKQTIARILNDDKIPCPTVYKNDAGIKYKNSNRLTKTRHWTYSTVAKILCNQMYLGDMVQKKAEQIFKTNGKKIMLDKDKWIIVTGTHEAIIDHETFNNAQTISAARTRTMVTEQNVTIFAGVFRCADCGRAMSKTISDKVIYYKCGTYKTSGVKFCSAHSIREDVLVKIIIDAIRREAKQALENEDVNKLLNIADYRQINDKSKDIEQLEGKLTSISRYKKKLYEDYADELISRDEYIQLKNEYDNDEAEAKQTISKLKESSFNLKDKVKQHDSYVKRFARYMDITHLTRELVVELIESIEISEDKHIKLKFKYENPF
jgi:DNA invertase Pin-like site-specific DNA recombinase